VRISEVANRAGVGIETVRFYERKKLIEQPRRPANGGFRSYSENAIARIRFIRQAQRLGFSLKEINELLSLSTDPSTDCAEIREMAAIKRQEVMGKIVHLKRIRDALDAIIASCPGGGSIRSCSILSELERGKDT
jgi:DNA-binding transcriptional MerR regulator